MEEVEIIKKFDDYDVERVIINYGDECIIMLKDKNYHYVIDYAVYKYSDKYLFLSIHHDGIDGREVYFINVNEIDSIKIKYKGD